MALVRDLTRLTRKEVADEDTGGSGPGLRCGRGLQARQGRDDAVTADQPQAPTTDDLLATLHRSHRRLVSLLNPLDAGQVSGPSYDDGWTIAQVASHLGSGAVIFELFVEAGLTGRPEPGIDTLQPIWDTWNAKPPAQQADDAVRADMQMLAVVEGLSAEQRARWTLDLFGGDKTLAELLRMRLSEHALHTWDIAVALDPTATVAGDAVECLVDTLPWVAGYAGRGVDQPVKVVITTTGPDRRFALELSAEGATLAPAVEEDAGTTAELHLPAEALERLVYGRLDPDHTPGSVLAHGVDLDVLRRSFPGI